MKFHRLVVIACFVPLFLLLLLRLGIVDAEDVVARNNKKHRRRRRHLRRSQQLTTSAGSSASFLRIAKDEANNNNRRRARIHNIDRSQQYETAPVRTATTAEGEYKSNNGLFFEGDIIPNCDQIKENYGIQAAKDLVRDGILDPSCLKNKRRKRNRDLALQVGNTRLWNKVRNKNGVAVIPYQFDATFNSPVQQKRVVWALEGLERESGVVSFVPRTVESAYINVRRSAGCSSGIGRGGGVDNLDLTYDCADMGQTQHEFLHALGFWHEQSRSDRDDYVSIVPENIKDGKLHAFNKQKINSLGSAYDYGSVMHYPKKAFSKNKEDTVVAPPGIIIGQRNGASPSDIIQLRLLYQCTSGPRTLAEYNRNLCTNDCPCWVGTTGCGNNDDLCGGDLICLHNKCVPGAPTPVPTPEPRYACQKMEKPFRSYGFCDSYAPGQNNYDYCTEDKDKSTGILAMDACSECGFCAHDGDSP